MANPIKIKIMALVNKIAECEKNDIFIEKITIKRSSIGASVEVDYKTKLQHEPITETLFI